MYCLSILISNGTGGCWVHLLGGDGISITIIDMPIIDAVKGKGGYGEFFSNAACKTNDTTR